MSEKPVIFISHSSKDKGLKQILASEILNCFDSQVDVFAAEIKTGENWFDKVMGKLNEADAIVVLITPNSVNISHWVWFELGYFWSRHNKALESSEEKQRIYYPLYMDGTELPNPVKDLQIQAGCLNVKADIEGFFLQICKQFNGGNPERVNFAVMEKQIAANPVYTDDEYEGKIRDYVSQQKEKSKLRGVVNNVINGGESVENAVKFIQSYGTHYKTSEDIFTGKLIFFNELDRELNMPENTSKRLLKKVASEFYLVPNEEKENSVRFTLGSNQT